MHTTKDTQKRVLHRLKIARGHLSKVIEMVEKGEYCIDIIHQNQAVQSALKEVDNAMFESHLKTCVVNQMKEGKTEKSIEEVMKVFKRNGGKKLCTHVQCIRKLCKTNQELVQSVE